MRWRGKSQKKQPAHKGRIRELNGVRGLSWGGPGKKGKWMSGVRGGVQLTALLPFYTRVFGYWQDAGMHQ